MIIRTSPRREYTALPNAIFRDRRLSIETKGLLAYLLSLPPNWEVRPAVIAKALSPERGRPLGREKLRRMFSEAQAAGYMARSNAQGHDEGGYFGRYTYIVGADPRAVAKEAAAQGLSVAVQPQTDLPSAAEPCAANPTTDKIKKDNNSSKIQTERDELQFGEAAIVAAPPGFPKGIPRRVIAGDRDRFEIEVANRLGHDGLEVLGRLPDSQVDQLCALQRRDSLKQCDLDRARELAFPPGGQKSEKPWGADRRGRLLAKFAK